MSSNSKEKSESIIWPSSNVLSPGALPCEPSKYIVGKKIIGYGSYSNVYECKSKITGDHYAIKKYSKKLMYGLESMLQSEFQILKAISMNHNNILTLIDYFETETELYLVSDLASGDLFSKIKCPSVFSDLEISSIIFTLLSTIKYLHQNQIIHCDIKPENILIQPNNSILIADFGLAKHLKPNQKFFEKSGTLSYMAPEMLNKSGYDYAVDVWSIGVTAYYMMCGYMPFDCENDQETTEAILSGDYSFEPEEYWNRSREAKDFVDCCFKVDPQQRCTIDELLLHPFIQSSVLKNDLSNLSLCPKIDKSRKSSIGFGVTSQGAFCYSPDVVSNLTSPVSSPNLSAKITPLISPATSFTNLNSLHNNL